MCIGKLRAGGAAPHPAGGSRTARRRREPQRTPPAGAPAAGHCRTDLKYLITGEIGAEIEYNLLLAPQVYDAAVKALNGVGDVPKWIPSLDSMFLASQGAGALSTQCPAHTHPKY